MIEMNKRKVEFKFKMAAKNKFWLQENLLQIRLYRIYTRRNLSSRGRGKYLPYIRIGDSHRKLSQKEIERLTRCLE